MDMIRQLFGLKIDKIFNKRAILVFVAFLFFLVSCKKPTPVEQTEDVANQSTLNDASLGNETGNIDDYFYDLEEGIEAQFLYYNSYITRGANTITNESGLNPYLDTLNFRTLPNYTVSGGSEMVNHALGISSANVSEYNTLYPLDEQNTTLNDWCDKMLVEYEGTCPSSVEVDFDYIISISSATGQNVDSVISPASFLDRPSPKESTFEVAWMNIDSLIWDNINERYDVIGTGETERLSASLTYNDDFFDSLIYIGITDIDPDSIDALMFVDRTEWQRSDQTYKSSFKSITLDTTFIYDQVKVPDDSPMFRINGDCNQNLQFDFAEVFSDFGQDWCPDSLETGDGRCAVVDTNSDGDVFDEEPCNCSSTINENWVIAKATDNLEDCILSGGYWIEYGTNECEFDPNGDNWRDCGWDGKCPGDQNYSSPDPNDTQGNAEWDTNEGFELNGQYDFDIITGTGDYFIDEGNGVSNEPAEFCYNVTQDSGGNDACSGSTPFEDRNCNGKWDDQESDDEGNGIWDGDEKFIDLSLDGEWDDDEPLYSISDRLATFIVDYANPSIPVSVMSFDNLTEVTLYNGTYLNPKYEQYSTFLEVMVISSTYSESFYDIDSIVTKYTNKIIEYPLTGETNDYSITKTRWFQDVLNTSYDESDLDNPQYGFDYTAPRRPSEYGYDYHLFKKSDDGDIIKMVHPKYFNYYGYFESFYEFEIGTWQEGLSEEETYIFTYDGILRSGEYFYKDTTIITPVADYYVETLYEVQFDNSVTVPFKKVTWDTFANGADTVCLNQPNPSWTSHPEVEYHMPDFRANYRQYCPPVDTILTNTFKIIKTETTTMIGSGVELGLRNTIWLGSAGVNKPLGIIKDQLERRWSEPYWVEEGSFWSVISRLELRSLRESESSSLFRFFKPIKKISLLDFENEVDFDNDPYIFNSSHGIHKLRSPHGK